MNKCEDKDTLSERFSALSREQQVKFLVRLAYEITVFTRGSYIDEWSIEQRRTVNELMHRVTEYADGLLANSQKMPSSVIANVIFDTLKQLHAPGILSRAWRTVE